MANLEQTDDDPKLSEPSTEKSAGLNPALVRDALTVPCLIPSFADARELVPAPYSCLVLHTHRRHVALPPMYLNKKRTGIQQELNADLLKYSSRYLMFVVFGLSSCPEQCPDLDTSPAADSVLVLTQQLHSQSYLPVQIISTDHCCDGVMIMVACDFYYSDLF